MIGNVSNPDTLYLGKEEQIDREVQHAMAAGVAVIGLECAVPVNMHSRYATQAMTASVLDGRVVVNSTAMFERGPSYELASAAPTSTDSPQQLSISSRLPTTNTAPRSHLQLGGLDAVGFIDDANPRQETTVPITRPADRIVRQ